MRYKKLAMALAIGSIFLGSTAAKAHHSFAATFKEDEMNTIEGVITDFRFRNPHVLIYLDVSNQDGTTTNWMVEGSSATGWRRSGWGDDSLQIGEMLRVTGSATIDGSPMVSIEDWALLDAQSGALIANLSISEDPQISRARGAGQALEAQPTEAAAVTFIPMTLATGEPNFTGVTSQIRGFTVGGPDANDAPMPYNDLGLSVKENWNIENDPQVFCDPPGLVRQAGYTPYGMIIKQYPDHVTFEYEEYGSRRSVFFDDELPRPGVPSHLGDSIARYEGESLVIETVNLLANASGHRGNPISDQIRVVEVYTRVDSDTYGSAVQTDTTVYDPLYLTEPWTVSRTKAYVDGYEFIENECEPPLRERPENVWQQFDWPE